MKNLNARLRRKFAFQTFLLAAVCLTASINILATAAIDRSFGTDGRIFISSDFIPRIGSFVIQPDDKILVVGDTINGDAATQGNGVAIRYNANGTLDQSFGSGGRIVLSITPRNDVFNAVAVQNNGKIIIVGSIQPTAGSPNTDFLIIRLNPNGSFDSTFGDNGVIIVNQGSNDSLRAVKIQPNGKIVAVGGTSDAGGRGAVFRLNANGTLDNTFGGGIVFIDHPVGTSETFTSLDFYANNRILLGGTIRFGTGSGSNVGLLTLLEPNGATVQDFANNGFSTNFSLSLDFSPEVKVLPNGKFVAGDQDTGIYSINGLRESSLLPVYNVGGFALLSNGNLAIVYQGSGGILKGIRIHNKNLQLVGSDENDVTVGNQLSGRDVAVQSNDKIVILKNSASGFEIVRLSGVTSNATRVIHFDEDRKTDIAVYRPSNYTFYGLRSSSVLTSNPYVSITAPPSQQRQIIAENYLTSGNAPNNVPQSEFGWFDYATNVSPAVFGIGSQAVFQFGTLGDVPVGGDYDGDGLTDFTVFRPSNGVWYILQSSNNQFRAFPFGQAGDKLVPADYDYDGITDFAVFRPSNGTWYISRSSDNGFYGVQFGASGDVPITGDFDGDGRADFTVFRPSNGVWYSLKTREGVSAVAFGVATDQPVPGDYDGDGRHDVAVFRAGIWYINGSRDGFYAVQWGLPDDIPVSVRY